MQRSKYTLIIGDQGRFHTIASRQVLRCQHSDRVPFLRLYEQHLGMVVCEVHMLHRLADERPQPQCLLRGLEVQNQNKLRHQPFLLDEEQPSQELLRDGEGRLPHLSQPHLREDPLQDISQLDLIQIRCT